ncbi:hypothetical protein [Streptomyces triculaminicus]|uniref:hypothetical protein n=1 Tax=Streptomyces triculaminicus TaxID=2816232 RepID=UPI0037B842F5
MRLSWPNLTWRPASWPARTYHATSRDGRHRYTIAHDGTSWTLRIWRKGNAGSIADETATSVEAFQQAAEDHAAAHTS